MSVDKHTCEVCELATELVEERIENNRLRRLLDVRPGVPSPRLWQGWSERVTRELRRLDAAREGEDG